MTLRPGRNLTRGGAVLAGLSLLGYFLPAIGWLLAAAAVSLAALAVVEAEKLRKRQRDWTVTRTMPSVVGRDVPFVVKLQLARASGPLVEGELRDETPITAVPRIAIRTFSLAEGVTTTSLPFECRIPVRGSWTFGPVWLRVRGPWGLVERQWSIDCPAKIKVLPEKFSSKDNLLQDERAELMMLDKTSRIRQQGVGTEFEMLTEFRPGDDTRRIDWRTTARVGRPVVRKFQIERHRDVMLVIDCGRLMASDARKGSKLDCAIDAALLLGRTALQGGDRCGLALFDDQVLGYLPPVSGLGSLRAISESVFDVQSRWRESNFARMFATLQSRQSKRSLIVVLSDIVDVETSTQFRTSLAALGKRHVVLFAALKTPLLREIVHAPVDSVLDGSRKAVTFGILREREQALHSLRRSGIHVLDVEPAKLTVPLINRFIELRQQNIL